MAFEKIYTFVDDVRKKILWLEGRIEEDPDKESRLRMRAQIDAYFDSLRIYYETVCSTAKFKHQRDYCKQIMTILNPSFCRGYFKEKK